MEYFVTDDGKYRIESLTAATIPGALRVMKEALFKDESVSIGTEVSTNPTAIDELLELCADAALDGVSLVAVVVDTGEVAAAMLNKIRVKASNTAEKSFYELFAERCTQASSRSLVNYIIDIEESCNLFEIYNVDCIFDLVFMATLREHRKQNLGTLLGKYSLDIARKIKDGAIVPITVADLGPKYSHFKKSEPIYTYPKICQALCTVKGSQEIARKFNFTVHWTIPHSKYIYDCKTYSERIGDEDAVAQVLALPLYN